MPRKKRRFNKLFEQLRANGGTPTGTGRVAEFHKYITGQKKITQTNKIPVEGRELYAIGLIPFALSATTNDPSERYQATISAYSLAGLDSRANLDEEDLGINRIEGGEQVNSNYYPALIKAKFDAGSVGVNENKKSGITEEEYRYEYGRTFSFPFGRTTQAVDAEDGTAETSIANVDELDVYRFAQNRLGAATNAANVPRSVSYEAEVFKTASKGQALTATSTIPSVSVN